MDTGMLFQEVFDDLKKQAKRQERMEWQNRLAQNKAEQIEEKKQQLRDAREIEMRRCEWCGGVDTQLWMARQAIENGENEHEQKGTDRTA